MVAPDLFEGAVPEMVEAGFALVEATGEATLVARAGAAADALPPETVLSGLSMGAGIASTVWEDRPGMAGVLLHGVGPLPEAPRRGTPLAAHVAEPDPFEAEEWVGWWRETAAERGLEPLLWRYPGARHLFTDDAIGEHDPAAAALLWSRARDFLAAL